jgi:hypothetical protein
MSAERGKLPRPGAASNQRHAILGVGPLPALAAEPPMPNSTDMDRTGAQLGDMASPYQVAACASEEGPS